MEGFLWATIRAAVFSVPGFVARRSQAAAGMLLLASCWTPKIPAAPCASIYDVVYRCRAAHLARAGWRVKILCGTAFHFPIIGPLAETHARRALQDPVKAVGVEFSEKALTKIVRITRGHPYFLQEWGYQAWNRAEASPIGESVVRGATAAVVKRLDENFFRVRFERCTPGEKRYLRAMAGLGSGAQRTGEIADALGVTPNRLGPARAKLIKKGMIYSPARGDMAFTVPLFDAVLLPGERGRLDRPGTSGTTQKIICRISQTLGERRVPRFGVTLAG